MLFRVSTAFLVLALLSLTVSAEIPPFGEPISLANTRYVPARESTSDYYAPDAPVLRTNGSDAFLFLWDLGGLRVARVDRNATRIARQVFPFAVLSDHHFDAVWTGSHFLVVATDARDGYAMWGRLVDAAGRPAGDPFPVGQGVFPALAFNGRYVLMLHSAGGRQRSTVLHPDGRAADFPPQELPGFLLAERNVVASNGNGFAGVIPSGSNSDALLVTFDGDGQISSQAGFDPNSLNWSIASDGDRYLVVGARAYQATAWLFRADGTLDKSSDLVDVDVSSFYRVPLVIWSGSRWIVSRVSAQEGQVLELDGDTAAITSSSWIHNTQVSLGVLDGKVIGAWWAGRHIVFGELPAGSTTTPVVQEAAAQRLLATATSNQSTLFLWNEAGGLRAGIRRVDGSWSERLIWPVAGSVLAASDGEEFVVVVDNRILRLDAKGEQIAGSELEPAPFHATAIAWNGTHYGLVGVASGNEILAARLTSSGFSTVTVIASPGEGYGAPRLSAADGRFLAAWAVVDECQDVYFCSFSRIDAVALTSAMSPIAATSLAEGEAPTGAFSVAWNGSHHVLVYSADTGLVARKINSSGVPSDRGELSAERGYGIGVIPDGDGVIIGWSDADGLIHRAFSFSRSGVLSDPVVVHEEPRPTEWGGILTRLADGRLAFAWTAPQPSAPHHGSSHLMLSISDSVPAHVPEAPDAHLVANVFSWTRPAGDVNGYRVEQRTGDDEWIEIDRWFDRNELSLVLPETPAPNVRLRVRAFSDVGAGPYSELWSGKRRAVRR